MFFKKLECVSRTLWYWLGILILCLSMEGIALYYQHVLDYGPCIHCIYSRIVVMLLAIVGFIGIFLSRNIFAAKILHILTLGLFILLGQVSFKLLGIEQGWIIESCSMNINLPNWFALDKWFPAVFEPWESCGYTPVLLWDITMAEALMAFSIILTCLALALNLLQFSKKS